MLQIGLTGGIGSGKTTVAQIFEVLGVPVYYADTAAKRLMQEDEGLKKQIAESFGDESYVDGKLNRSFLSAEVFSNPGKLKLLNSIVHPATIADAEHWMAGRNTPYAIKEAALLFESDAYLKLDLIIGVSSPYPLRIKRILQRDNISVDEIEKRIASQMDEQEKLNRCEFIIYNDEKEFLTPQVLKIHQAILNKIT